MVKLVELFGEDRGDPPPPRIANFDEIEVKDDKGKIRMMRIHKSGVEIAQDLFALTDGWPKKVVGELFWENPKTGEVRTMRKATQLFGWISQMGGMAEWARGQNLLSKDEFFEYLVGGGADGFAAISAIPQFSPAKDVYYLKSALPEGFVAGDTGALKAMTNWFTLADPGDAVLIRAAMMTPLWGGNGGGMIPMIVIDSTTDNDPDKGRGVGKTKLSQAIMSVAGGQTIDFAGATKAEDFKKTILTAPPGAKFVRIDNLHATNYSNEALEQLVTSKTISGQKMYIGYVEVKNSFVYLITMNGSSLGKDLAKRSLIITLARPSGMRVMPGWDARLSEWLEASRIELMRDIAWRLTERDPVDGGDSAGGDFRFKAWVDGVLRKAADTPDEFCAAMRLLQERMTGIDNDTDGDEDFEAAIDEMIAKSLGSSADVDSGTYLIPISLMHRWMRGMGMTNLSIKGVSAYLKNQKFKRWGGTSRTMHARLHIWKARSSEKKTYVLKEGTKDRVTASVLYEK